MSFKKFHPLLKEALQDQNMEAPLPFQKEILPKLKGGMDVYGVAPEGSGKTTALILAIVHKLKAEAFEDSPRALIMVKDKEAALHLKDQFEMFTNETDLRVYCAYDEYDLEKQKNEIYVGVDIVIATPKRLNKLYFLNGIHLGQLQIFAMEDAEFLMRNNYQNDVLRVVDSLKKCQYVILTEKMSPKLKSLQENMMSNAHIVKV
ncbi:DEAD/DEAH box helicase [Bizionia argentinensis JUB59]|uniref:DEAD/DEAH box helicase n=1 Tax=Bizionia argentinensis JUB59 TaxID=1046627 RepID=G2EF11_9FLAO|nr:DEAD/DEAH box helicase [Bizionia argentinensis]EGV42951.1 DEAD/DEAH box helicase [Bizionia argentinensis JUB59]